MPGSPLTFCWWCGHPAQTAGGWAHGMALAVRDGETTWECLDHRACMRRVMARVARVN